MCNILKLRGKIVENGLRQSDIAEAIGIDPATLSRRLKTGENFTVAEANKITSTLHLTADEALQIFLPTAVQ